MRIIAGKFKGRKIFSPKDKTTRPLKDLTKESIFNLLMHSKFFKYNFNNKKILDAFSGIGSFGIECISRGSSHVSFVENYKPSIIILKKNINNLKIYKNCKVFEIDSLKFFKQNFMDINFDLIFLDPPYNFNKLKELTENIYDYKLLSKKGIIVIHRHKKSLDDFSKKFVELECRYYGISKILYLRAR